MWFFGRIHNILIIFCYIDFWALEVGHNFISYVSPYFQQNLLVPNHQPSQRMTKVIHL
jgi:hypothetical protein